MSSISQVYELKCAQRSDINEHLPTLRTLATQCTRIAELGVRGKVSTYAFLMGLATPPTTTNDDLAQPLLWMNDLDAVRADDVQTMAKVHGVCVEFVKGNDLEVPLPEKAFDMVFIDTWHVYGHLKRELERYAPHCTKVIAMHDTTVDAIHGESLRLRMNVAAQSTASGYPESEIRKGLWPAVEEFLLAHPEWRLVRRYTNNNGLTVLARVGVDVQLE